MKSYPIISDLPATNDLLDFKSYSNTLSSMILHEGSSTPVTIGVFGPWGSGKTTLMKILKADLEKEEVNTIWFNAWKYSKDENLWAAFLQSILLDIKKNLKIQNKLYFNICMFWNSMKWEDLPGFLLANVLKIFISLIPYLVSWLYSQGGLEDSLKTLLKVGGGSLSLLIGIFFVIKPWIKDLRQIIKIDFSILQRKYEYEQHIAFFDNFHKHFENIVKSLPGRRKKKLCVFIDDLDRCSPDGILQVLNSIKLFLDIEGCVFVLGLDDKVVKSIFSAKNKNYSIEANEYIDKIIQIPFYLPPLSRSEIKNFIQSISPDLPDKRCVEVFSEGLRTNPREIKKTINVFTLLWVLATNREGIKRIITPVRLAKIVVIQHGYKELFEILKQQPNLLVELENYFRISEDQKVKTLDEESQQTLNIPQSLLPFLENLELKRILTIHELDSGDDDANFANLSFENLVIYFTLAKQATITQETPTVNFEKTFHCYALEDQKIVQDINKIYSSINEQSSKITPPIVSELNLREQIEAADVFMLYWSEAAKKSPFVEKAVKLALEIKNPISIRPVYWEKPIPAPFEELEHLHFSFLRIEDSQ